MRFPDVFHLLSQQRNSGSEENVQSRHGRIFLFPGPQAELLTGALYNFYSAPDGFCFDILCEDDPIIDDRNSPEYNVDMYVQKFKKFADKQSQYFRTNNIIMTFGMDFNYQFAHKNFKNMDKLIR